MIVKAAPGTRCPKEGKPRDHITDSEAVQVPNTTYYRRLVDDGSLIATDKSEKKKGGQA